MVSECNINQWFQSLTYKSMVSELVWIWAISENLHDTSYDLEHPWKVKQNIIENSFNHTMLL